MVPGGPPLLDIGYKYNTLKVIYPIFTEYSWITKAFTTYLYKYPDQFIMFPFSLLLFPFLFIISSVISMRLAPTKNQGSMI